MCSAGFADKNSLMEVLIRDNADVGCVLGAKIIARMVREKPDAVLGLATGRTPLRLYQELIRMHREEALDFSHITTFNLDEYVGLPATHDQSYRYFMRENLFRHINIDQKRTHVPAKARNAFDRDLCRP